MAYGRHAQGKGRHRQAPAPSPAKRMLLWVLVLVSIAVFAPVLAGIGLALGILFGWMGNAITRN